MVCKAQKKLFLLIAAVALMIIFFSEASCEGRFSIRRIGNINPYSENSFAVDSPEAGQLKITIHDSICVYRTIGEQIPAGESKIYWDGCGYNQEKLYEKTYTITAEMQTESGEHFSVSFASPIEYPKQCLQYALPSSEYLYLDNLSSWFLEYRTVTDGTVCIDLYREKEAEPLYSYSISSAGAKIGRKDFSSITGKKTLPEAGVYSSHVYEKSRPEQYYEFPLHILELSPEREPVKETGEIMPDRSMTDEEIWEMMMKPSVVVDIDFFKHQDIYEHPDEKSSSMGTLHGQTQGVKVICIENGWALIGAWNHEDASYKEGWVPQEKLKTVYPAKEYGILIDKQSQTLSVYKDGRKIDTLLISSGRAEKNKLYQETSAGSFLTGYHRVNFSMNGKKYDYVIQYDGGNLLHQTPYEWGQQKKDFRLGRGYLGAKASHACIRIQPEPGEGGLNAFWIFTHIPYHTRVIILDDQEKRESEHNLLTRGKKQDVDISSLKKDLNKENTNDEHVVITFGGCILPGGTKAFNQKKESFSSYVLSAGYDKPLSNTGEIFHEDDYSVISLGYVIQDQKDDKSGSKGSRHAVKEMQELFKNASVELIQIISDEYPPSGNEGISNALKPYAETLERKKNITVELKGHLFGFAGCSEKEYLSDPGIIDQRITDLKSKGCEKIIFFAEWGENGTNLHSIVQEAMAHRCVREGADLVIGNQKGNIQGADYIEGIPVFYSLGDLLDGSTSVKTKKQQGILLQADFCFEDENDTVKMKVIPVLPYGNEKKDKNEYCPVINLNETDKSNIIRYLWLDTPDQVMEKLYFDFTEK